MKINFVIPTYNHGDKLVCCVSSIFAQTNPNWSIHVVNDCGDEDGINKLKLIYGDSDKIKFTTLPDRANDWGHTPRNFGLNNCTEELVTLSGGDNLYLPIFVDEFIKSFQIRPEINFVYCNMVHNWIRQDYIPIDSKIEYGKIDIGNVVLKTEFAKQLKLDTNVMNSDWLFFRDYVGKFSTPSKIMKINKYLYVHN
jgi:glycosyltransferase involved in cell wall biosynthesis